MSDWTPNFIFQLAAVAGLLVLSFLRGAAPERFMALTLGVIFCVDTACGHHLVRLAPAADKWMHFILDVAAFGAILAVALKAHRMYPLWLGGLQISKLITDLLHTSFATPKVAVLVVMNHAAFNLQLGVLAIGLLSHLRRRRSWKHAFATWET